MRTFHEIARHSEMKNVLLFIEFIKYVRSNKTGKCQHFYRIPNSVSFLRFTKIFMGESITFSNHLDRVFALMFFRFCKIVEFF